MRSSPPFALFVLVDVSTDQLNKILEAAFKGTQFSENCLWLPSSLNNYSDAPRKVPRKATEGTAPPLTSYKSPFIGKKAEDAALWLRNKPEDADVDVNHFAILDRSVERGMMVMSRQGGRDLTDMEKLEFVRLDAEFATSVLFALQAGSWEEMAQSRSLVKIEY